MLAAHIDEQSTPHRDGWASALTGFGTHTHDKRQGHTFRPTTTLSYESLVELYRGDDLAAKAVDSVPNECFRQGYEFTVTDEGDYADLRELVEQEMARLEVDRHVQRLMCLDRGVGGGAILLGVNDGRELSEPLDDDKASSLDWLTTLEPIELWPDQYYDDPAGAKYGEVRTYRVNAMGSVGAFTGPPDSRLPPPNSQVIHETRLILLSGIKVSRYQRTNTVLSQVWGDSMLVRLYEVLRDFTIAFQSAGIIVTDFSQAVFHMENLTSLVLTQSNKVQARLAAIELGRSTARAVVVDTKEKFERQTTSVAGLADLIDRLASRLAAAVDMPLTLLMGQSPKGLGNEGESDVRFYYDRIASVQRRVVAPILRRLIKIIVRGLGKKIPKHWTIKFNPLWQLTDGEKAEARLTQARADSIYMKGGALFPDEVRTSRFSGDYSFETHIDPSKKAPGPVLPAPNPAALPPTPAGPKAPANGHVVGGYARRNPVKKAATPETSEGGDSAPKDKRDHAMMDDALENLRAAASGGADVATLLARLTDLVAATRPHTDDVTDPEYPETYSREFAGMTVHVECPAGSTRHWTRADGSPGATVMNYDYGCVEGAVGADGDEVDVYLGPDEDAEHVYVVELMRYAGEGVAYVYDEDKVMLGFDSEEEATAAILSQYDEPNMIGDVLEMSLEAFKARIGEAQASIGRLGKNAAASAVGSV